MLGAEEFQRSGEGIDQGGMPTAAPLPGMNGFMAAHRA